MKYAALSWKYWLTDDVCLQLKQPPGRLRALDCGAGIGRVTKLLLQRHFSKVDLVEQNPAFLKEAKSYLGPSKKIGELICCGELITFLIFCDLSSCNVMACWQVCRASSLRRERMMWSGVSGCWVTWLTSTWLPSWRPVCEYLPSLGLVEETPFHVDCVPTLFWATVSLWSWTIADKGPLRDQF